MSAAVPAGWRDVCGLEDLTPERGVAALLGSTQIAIFRTHAGEVFAVDNRDPYSGAMVISRGIVGSRDECPTVASPMYKQVFDLRTGACFDDVTVCLPTYPVRVAAGRVQVRGTAPHHHVVPCAVRRS